MWYTAKCLFFGLRDSMLRILFIVRSIGLYVVSYLENVEVHKHYFCVRAACTGFYIFE